MKRIWLAMVTATSICSALSLEIVANPAFAQTFTFPAPEPPELPRLEDFSYITSSPNGEDFYVGNPFFSKVTPDFNIHVSSVILMTDGNNAKAAYVQVDCGRKIYRNLIPWVKVNSYGDLSLENHGSYEWQLIVSGSILESFQKQLCSKAASDYSQVGYR